MDLSLNRIDRIFTLLLLFSLRDIEHKLNCGNQIKTPPAIASLGAGGWRRITGSTMNLQLRHPRRPRAVQLSWVEYAVEDDRIDDAIEFESAAFIFTHFTGPILGVTERTAQIQFTLRRGHTIEIDRMRSDSRPDLYLAQRHIIGKRPVGYWFPGPFAH